MILRCTKKLLTVIRPQQLIDCTPDGEDWYANLLWLNGRKCLLLTHAATLFTALEADVRTADLRDPGRLVTALISRRLLVPYFFAASLRCQASSVAGVTRKTPAQRLRGTSAPARRTRPGRPAHTAPGRRAAAGPRSHAGVPEAQHRSPGHRGTPGRPCRVAGT